LHRCIEGRDVDRLFQDCDARLRGEGIGDGRPRDHDDGHVSVPEAHGFQNVPARHAGHQQIGEDDLVLPLVKEGERLFPTLRSVDAVTQGPNEID